MASRSYNSDVRAALCSILADSWPQPWCLADLRRAFGPQHYQRVYLMTSWLMGKGLALHLKVASNRIWVTWYDNDLSRSPRCVRCENICRELVHLPWAEQHYGGYCCSAPPCRLEASTTPWRWPVGEDLQLV